VSLDKELAAWRQRPLTKNYRYLIFDARYEKVREYGRVVSKAFVVVIGISDDGISEAMVCWIVNSESLEAWDSCMLDLKERGLNGVEYTVSNRK